MDAKQIEAILVEVGKVFRLCRFYPATHPTVLQAMADLSAALRSLAALGDVELRIGPTSLALGDAVVATKNPQLQEFAGLLYGQGYRAIHLEPGATADEFATLIRATVGAAAKSGSALGVAPPMPQLPHIHPEQAASRKSTTAKPARTSSPGMQALGEGSSLSARSTGVFRPNALPPEIEADRLVALLEFATAEGARGPLTRMGAVVALLAEQRNFRILADAVKVLAKWQRSDDAAAAEAARRALAVSINEGTLSGIVAIVADGRTAAEQRQVAAEALGALGERAVPVVFEAYLGASNDAARGACASAVHAAGASALAYLISRVASDQTLTARAAATLLGASGDGAAVPPLVSVVRHPDAGVRRAAVGALARLGGAEGSRAVVAALRDGDPGVRLEAATGVARLGEGAFGPIVLGRLKDEPDDGVVIALIDTLGRLKEPRAVSQLVELAVGVSGVFRRFPITVRIAAIRALADIGTPEALAAIEPYKQDRHPDLRNAALGTPQ